MLLKINILTRFVNCEIKYIHLPFRKLKWTPPVGLEPTTFELEVQHASPLRHGGYLLFVEELLLYRKYYITVIIISFKNKAVFQNSSEMCLACKQ